jgi:hypothetical protein
MTKLSMYFGGLLLALLLIVTTGHAQQRQDEPAYGGSMDARDHGYQHGYRDGVRQGRADLNSNSRPNYDTENYRHGDLGYEEYMGSHEDFRRGYQTGFKDGYEDGYGNRPLRSDVYGLSESYDPDRRPRTEEDSRYYEKWGYSDVAFDTGYRDGLSAGSKDFRDRKDYRPEKHDSYEDGDHGYRKSYGSKDQYKDQYRKGYLRGYEDAFNRRAR